MAIDPTRNIQECAHFIKNLDPQLYERLMRAMDQLVHQVTVAVTEASTDEVLRCQGRAQQAIAFLRMFDEPREPTKPSS